MHSPEPWRLTNNPYTGQVRDSHDRSVFVIRSETPPPDLYVTAHGAEPDNMRRIVACVNFMRDVTTDQIEQWLAKDITFSGIHNVV